MLWTQARTDEADSSDLDVGYLSRSRSVPDWLDQAKLRELGFNVSRDLNTAGGERYYQKQLPRDALAVIEFDGPAYQRVLRRAREYAAREEARRLAAPGDQDLGRRAKWAKENAQHEEHDKSRLFVIDVGRDRSALRSKYPDRSRYAIVRGHVDLYVAGEKEQRWLGGAVRGLNVDAINVPRRFRTVLDKMSYRRFGEYPTSSIEVKVAIGGRLEPWISAASDAKPQ